ncbi:MAG TPA: FAD-dependent oxidoreductase [Actinomycetota bacterium]|nr:FAD-dependent oxidoreductase [Actinomycetota bacterium]
MEVAIIGGGIVGLSTAFFLQRDGHRCTVIERGTIGTGTSVNNAGWIVPSFSSPLPGPGVIPEAIRWLPSLTGPLSIRPRADPRFARWLLGFCRACTKAAYARGQRAMTALASRAHAALDSFRAAGIAFEEHRRAMLVLCLSRTEFERRLRSMEALRSSGYEPVPIRDPRRVEPAIREEVHGAIRLVGDRNVEPRSLLTGLRDHLRRSGVEVVQGARVERIRPTEGSVEVRAGSAAWRVDAAVIAAGLWSAELVRSAGGPDLPLEAGKGYTLDYEPPPVELSNMLYLQEGRVAVSPLAHSVRLAGTVELGNADPAPVPRRIAGVARTVGRYLRGWPADAGSGRAGVGFRPMTPDGLPVIGPLDRWPHVVVATGHGKQGLTLGPPTGEAVAEYLTSGRMPPSVSAFRPERFREGIRG